ncbi:SpoIID/LytB domain-containing protein [bacterium]|nr:SpoIID/LytB domain-containing protein [bacterium]
MRLNRFLSSLLLSITLILGISESQAQQVFRDRNYRVRICVKEDVDQLAIQGDGSYQILSSVGKPLGTLVGGRPYFIQITRGRPGSRVYRLVLNELDGHMDRDAIRLGMEARDKYKLPVKVMRLPGRTADATRIIVAVGEYSSAQQAQEQVKNFPGVAIASIYEDKAVAREGQVRLLGEQGSILANDPQRLRLMPLDMAGSAMGLFEVTGNSWSARDLAKARHYRGEIDLVINEKGTLTAVNDLWIEYYVYSVVPSEIGDDAPLESMKAQAVAARSEAVAKIQMGIVSSSFFDFYDTAMAQVYKGKGSECAAARQAADGTRGEILIYHGEPVDAVYSHSCGGTISTASDVWGTRNAGWSRNQYDTVEASAPDLSDWQSAHEFTSNHGKSLCNPGNDGYPNYGHGTFRWSKTYSGAAFSEMADRMYNTGRVRDVVIDKRTASGRVSRMRIIGENREVEIHRELEIREAMGDVMSTLFTFTKQADSRGRLSSITVYGAGWGHGVGMCQMGAVVMAHQGYNYRQILGHYFHDVRIRQLYR